MIIYYVTTISNFTVQPTIFLYIPFCLVLTVITTLGLGCLFAALNVKYRDFRYIIPFTIQFLMFVTPVIYPLTVFKDNPILQYFLAINPITGVILLARSPFVNEPINWYIIGVSLVSAILLLFIGIYVFRKMEAFFADIA